jgi:hypothetical protein
MSNIKLFESKQIRSEWSDKEQKWLFSVVDVVNVLTDSQNPQVYWRVLKKRLLAEGNETVTNCNGLKMTAPDGKMRMTDVANTEQILRLIQSIPSPKAEPFKIWLARVGYERLEEIENPELSMERMQALYEKKGYSKEWIDKRMRGMAVRQDLTDEWKNCGATTSLEYAILTNEIMQGAFDLKVDDYKQIIPPLTDTFAEGNREVQRNLTCYNLDMIISVGYRIKSNVATHFCQRAKP